MNRKRILIVMAAGSGVRMGATVPKQFLDLGGVPILRRTIEAFISVVPDIKVVTVLPGDYIAFGRTIASFRTSTVLRHWFPEGSPASIP